MKKLLHRYIVTPRFSSFEATAIAMALGIFTAMPSWRTLFVALLIMVVANIVVDAVARHPRKDEE